MTEKDLRIIHRNMLGSEKEGDWLDEESFDSGIGVATLPSGAMTEDGMDSRFLGNDRR